MKHLFLLLASLFYVGVAHGQARTPANYTAATVAFGSVTGSYTQFLAGGKALVHLEIYNGTNQGVYCSWDDTNGIFIPTTVRISLGVGSADKYIQTATKCKHAGVAPTSGNVELFGYY
jgi:hypothetical protein